MSLLLESGPLHTLQSKLYLCFRLICIFNYYVFDHTALESLLYSAVILQKTEVQPIWIRTRATNIKLRVASIFSLVVCPQCSDDLPPTALALLLSDVIEICFEFLAYQLSELPSWDTSRSFNITSFFIL